MKHMLALLLVCLLVLASTGCQVVTGENHTLGPGETLSGDLVVVGGDSTLAQGSRITGSLVMMGGNVRADGAIDGDVSLSGGNITFGPTAIVRGSVKRTGGGLHIAQGANVPSASYNQSLAIGDAGRTVANGLILFLMLPVALILTAVALLTTRATRAVPPAVAAGPGSGEPSPVSNQLTALGGTRAGLESGIAFGIILVGLGVAFLLGQVLNVDVWHYAWPSLFLVPGLLCFAGMVLGGREAGRLAPPGSILTMLGLIFLYQSTFGQFQTWAYAWALIVAAIGIGRLVEGWWTDRPELRQLGLIQTRNGLVLFLGLAAFFELGLNLSGRFSGDLGRFAFPALLILTGVLLVFGRGFKWPVVNS